MNNNNPIIMKQLAIVIICISPSFFGRVIASHSVNMDNSSVVFDPIFLTPGLSQQTDLSRFEHGAAIFPGVYDVDTYVNSKPVGKNRVTFSADKKSNDVHLCISQFTLRNLNLNLKEINENARKALEVNNDACHKFTDILPGAGVSYDSGNQRLDLTIPQALLRNAGSGYIEPELWDKGVNGIMLGYQSNYYTMSSRGNTSESAFVGLNSGINIGTWQLRHNGNYNWQNEVGGNYQRTNTYVQRDLPSITSRLIIGENNTSGNIFDSSPFRGIRLTDDERMLPQSERGYAPEIRGVARTNAKVTVKQNGQILREITVVPGAFKIGDLNPTGYGGDLDVIVTESDGAIQTFSIPYSSVNQLLRPGAHRYELIGGEYNYTGFNKHRAFYQGTVQYGINNTVTSYGGFQSSHGDYYSITGGAALNTPVGAVAFDATHADTRFSNAISSVSGQSYRLSYSKRIPDTKSSVSIAAYRYSTSGYLDLNSAMRMMNEVDNGRNPDNVYRPKNRFSMTLSQGLLEGFGQLYITGYSQDYWNADNAADLQYQLGYNTNIGSITMGLNTGRTRNGYGHMESTAMINLSLPLGSSSTLTGSLSRDSSGNYGEQLALSGVTGSESQMSYSASGTHYDNGSGSSGTFSGSYRSNVSNLSGSISGGKQYISASAGASGTLLAYSGGAIMTPYTGDSFAIVEANGAKGAKVGNYSGVKIDRFGHAAVPYLNAYQINEISLDPNGTGQDVELQNTAQSVVPYNGAIVKVKFDTISGTPLLITLNNADKVPFGASVSNSSGKNIGVVGQGGQIFVRVLDTNDSFNVKWGDGTQQSCNVSYLLTQNEVKANKFINKKATCYFS